MPDYDERLNMLSGRAACRSLFKVWCLYLISVTDRNTSSVTAGVWLPVEKVTSVVRKTRTKSKRDGHDRDIFSGNNHCVCYSTEQQVQVPHESIETGVRWYQIYEVNEDPIVSILQTHICQFTQNELTLEDLERNSDMSRGLIQVFTPSRHLKTGPTSILATAITAVM